MYHCILNSIFSIGLDDAATGHISLRQEIFTFYHKHTVETKQQLCKTLKPHLKWYSYCRLVTRI